MSSQSPKRILLVEDNENNRTLARFLLANAGYEVVEAIDGIQAIEQARACRPNLILLDIQLPEMGGYEVIKHLRCDPELAEIPVVALTAFAMAGEREKTIAAGFAGYIEKPIEPLRFPSQVASYFP